MSMTDGGHNIFLVGTMHRLATHRPTIPQSADTVEFDEQHIASD